MVVSSTGRMHNWRGMRYVEGFEAELTRLGFAPLSVLNQLYLVAHLSRWFDAQHLAAQDLTVERVETFDRLAAGRVYGVVLPQRACERTGLDPFPRSHRGACSAARPIVGRRTCKPTPRSSRWSRPPGTSPAGPSTRVAMLSLPREGSLDGLAGGVEVWALFADVCDQDKNRHQDKNKAIRGKIGRLTAVNLTRYARPPPWRSSRPPCRCQAASSERSRAADAPMLRTWHRGHRRRPG